MNSTDTPRDVSQPHGDQKETGDPPARTTPIPFGPDQVGSEPWIEALLDDHRQRWHEGQRLTAKEYLVRDPALEGNIQGIAGLVFQEYVLRKEAGESPNLEEYLRQFPQCECHLRQLFEADHLVEVLLPPKTDPQPGRRFGEYELLEEIGRGGMGIVYKARQISLNRFVALKLIRAQWATDPESRRFRLEAEAAANLQHPNIVAVHEFGEQAGQPYFSMDYVEGLSLAAIIQKNPLPSSQAARYLKTIAAAIHYAHQQGTLHRDLKPSNVLIDHFDQPRVTDFGLARRNEGESGMTQTGQILGTPSYMPPEQADSRRRAELGPASDVYALGAMLYDLLTGRPPFRAATPMETLKQVVDLEPVPPSRLNPNVPRDLETICLKCLQKEAPRRYANPQELANDLGRFLAGEPIRARPVSMAERLWRWCHRKPLVAGLAAALVLVIGGSLMGLAILWLEAERQRGVAVDNAQKKEEQRLRAEEYLREGRRAVREHFIQLSEIELNDKSDPSLLHRRQLEAARKYFQEFLAQNPDNPDLLAEVAEAHFRVAHITAEIGSKADAIASYEQAREIYVKLNEDDPEDPTFQAFLAGCYQNLGLLEMELRHLDQAEGDIKKGLVIESRLVQEHPGDRIYLQAQAQSHINLGTLFRTTGRLGQCEQEFKQGQETLEVLARDYPAQLGYRQQLGMLFNNFGVLYRHKGRAADSEVAYRKAIKIQEDLVHAQPTALGYQSDLALSLFNLGFLFSATGRRDLAEPPYRRAAELWEHLVRYHPEDTRIQHYFARTIGSLAIIYRETKRPQQAEREALRALDVQEKLVRANPNVAEFVFDLAITQCQMAELARESDKLEAALNWYAKAIATMEKAVTIDKGYPNAGGFLGTYYRARAEILTDLGRHAEAIPDFDRAIERIGGHDQVKCRLERAISFARLGQHERATAEAAALTEGKDEPQNVLYVAACVYALSAATVVKDSSLADQYADKATELLRQAVRKGFRSVEEMKSDKELNSLRSREDFQKLLSELEKKEQGEQKKE